MDKTTEDIIKGNKLIAGLFMIERLSDGKYFHINPELLLANKRWFLPEELKYHSSWDWLMPAWIEFRKLWNGEENEHGKWITSLQYYLAYSDEPIRFFERLVYAIQWYNQQTQTP